MLTLTAIRTPVQRWAFITADAPTNQAAEDRNGSAPFTLAGTCFQLFSADSDERRFQKKKEKKINHSTAPLQRSPLI